MPKKTKKALKKPKAIIKSKKHSFVVAIGASAGGLEAFKEMLSKLDTNTDMAFVFIPHLSPNHESLLVPILSRSTDMEVIEVKNKLKIQGNCVYILPPNAAIEIENGVFKMMTRNADEKPHLPIDRFFKSLAYDQKERAISIVLSGTGSDGAEGSRIVKDQGGLAFAQSTESARYDSMPTNAIVIDHIDFVLPPKKIAEELNALADVPHKTDKEIEPHTTAEEEYFYKILLLLKQSTGTDFTLYKPTTILRRISRRIFLNKLTNLKEYFALLQVNSEERDLLSEDVLINVTTFFRDPESFNHLKKKILPEILRGKTPDSPLRIWVAGCSTGEEAYSVAICVFEVMGEEAVQGNVQIFATDLSDKCIERARLGKYLVAIEDQVSPERLSKYFSPTDDGYRISKKVRDICVFAKHDLSRDPAYSKLDIISCRNLLIYLGPELQARVFENFHYSLNPTGTLILGNSETVGKSSHLFTSQDPTFKVFRRKESFSRMNLPASRRETFSSEQIVLKSKKTDSSNHFDLQVEADRAILSRYSPPSVVVNSKFDILQFRGSTDSFLVHKQGEASLNLLKMAREGMNSELKKGLLKAIDKNLPYRKEALNVPNVGLINFEIIPLKFLAGERCYLVVFETVPEPIIAIKTKKGTLKTSSKQDLTHVAKLRLELNSVRENLHSVIQDFEMANQDLQSANEEIVSSNEELQSTNEELETSKEELQSTNEELSTVNDELQDRNLELFSLNNDLINILNSVQIPIVIVGTDLNIRRYTSSANYIFNLIPADIGRPFSHISSNFLDVAKVTSMIMTVLDTAVFQEVLIRGNESNIYHLRVRPYKTQDNKIEGAVISIQEIQEAQFSVDLSQAFLSTVSSPMVVLSGDFKVMAFSPDFAKTFKFNPKDLISKSFFDLGKNKWDSPRFRKDLNIFDKVIDKELIIPLKNYNLIIKRISRNQLVPVKYLICIERL